MKLNAQTALNSYFGRTMLNWMHEIENAMHVYESDWSKKNSKA